MSEKLLTRPIKLSPLQNFRDGMVSKLKKARLTLADHQAKLKEMRRAKVSEDNRV